MQKLIVFLIGYCVFLHLVLAVFIVKFDALQRLSEKLGYAESRHAWHYRQMMALHRRIDACVPEGAVLFIGDSFIQGMCVAAITEKGVNFGIGGDTTTGVLRRLDEYTCLKKAKAVVLAVGYNDLRELDNDAIVANCREIFKLIPKNCPVLFCSMLPTDERYRHERYNDRIAKLNRSIANICSSIENTHFVDLTEKLMDTEGNLSLQYHEEDGVHLNGKGYSVYNETLRTSLMSFGL
ncbi:MAG: GDSL-type esterase/lipase family protein [Sedimentisphaerales bacterium]|jgi:lysophospholipase L1-like esterase